MTRATAKNLLGQINLSGVTRREVSRFLQGLVSLAGSLSSLIVLDSGETDDDRVLAINAQDRRFVVGVEDRAVAIRYEDRIQAVI